MKKITRPTLSVGIPAFNEEANIGFILKDLLTQKTEGFNLEKIIVNSDGSSDKTVGIARSVKNKKIVVLDNKKRTGRAFRQNQIMKLSNSDALVLVDADTQIKDKNFLEKIASPIFSNKADLTSVRVQELPSRNLVGKVLDTSMKLKKYIFENINNGDNLYTCHGRARAFSKNLYKKINFKDSITEDAFSYLYCVSKGFKYKFVSNTEILYQLPDNFTDHENQSIRFINSRKFLVQNFGNELVKRSYKLPLNIVMLSFIKFVVKNPLNIALYLIIFTSSKFKALTKKTKNTWEMSASSKNLRKATA